MKTIGYGLVQIPIVTRYRVCCIKRSLAGGVTSAGWQEIIGCTIRILLLSSWGLQSIDYSLPQTAEKIIGVYIEFAILSIQVANGMVILIGLWANNLFFLYPTLVIIPACFLCDIIVKGSCYAALFLTPEVTSFGVLSLIEVWFRNLSLMYGWIVIISYIYYTRKEWKPTEVNVELATNSDRNNTIIRRTSSKSPFSRNSSLSQRGRRSFLLRKGSGKETNGHALSDKEHVTNTTGKVLPTEEDIALLELSTNRRAGSTVDGNSSLNNNTLRESSKDGESDILLGESATMSLKRSPPPQQTRPRSRTSDNVASTASKPYVPASLQRSPPRYKKRGGFVPEVLRTPSYIEETDKTKYSITKKKSQLLSPVESSLHSESTAANTITYSSSIRSNNDRSRLLELKREQKAQEQRQMKGPPSLPSKPPAGITASTPQIVSERPAKMSWFKKVKDKPAADSPIALGKKHVPDPVLV